MSLENIARNRSVLLEQIGKSGLNLKYPKEFELYVIALELIDGEGGTLRYFIFPVNPSGIDEMNATVSNIKKTMSGVTVLRNPTFNPGDINLSGTFGRKMRVLLGTDYVNFISSFTTTPGALGGKVTKASLKKGFTEFFDERVKTGYGCLNIMKDILDEVGIVDEKGPRTLILHNLAFGTTYVVEPMNLKVSMSQETNMVHQYILSLKAVAPYYALTDTTGEDDRFRLITTGRVQSETNRLVQNLTQTLSFFK